MTKEAQQLLYTNTVIPLIKETGFLVTLNHPNNGEYDPDTGYSPVADTESIGYAIESKAEVGSLSTSLAEKLVKTIKAIEINEPVPNVDTMTFKGKTYQIIKQEPLETGEVLFLYTIYLGA
jgi:hypothetical protein